MVRTDRKDLSSNKTKQTNKLLLVSIVIFLQPARCEKRQFDPEAGTLHRARNSSRSMTNFPRQNDNRHDRHAALVISDRCLVSASVDSGDAQLTFMLRLGGRGSAAALLGE